MTFQFQLHYYDLIKCNIFQANGYVYGSGEERSIQSLLSCAVGAQHSLDYSELINK